MNSLKYTALESNPYLKINFDGGDLSSDAGLFLIKEFAVKIGLVKLIYSLFQTNYSSTFRIYDRPCSHLRRIHVSGRLVAASVPCRVKNRKTVKPDGFHVYVYRNNHGIRSISDHTVLLWSRQIRTSSTL